jgi:hypothetical protein
VPAEFEVVVFEVEFIQRVSQIIGRTSKRVLGEHEFS